MPRSMADIQRFADLGYQIIDGDLILDSVFGLKDLTLFSKLIKVTGGVIIAHNPELPSLHGLENLAFTGRAIRIFNNLHLCTASSLGKLTSTGGIEILDNPQLRTIAFNRVNKAENLEFMNNPSLRSITGMNEVTTTGFFFVYGHPRLTKIYAFQHLKTVTRNFFFDMNDSLTNIDWAGHLQTVSGAMGISYNKMLQNLNGLKSLETVGNFLRIDFNPELQNLDGLGKLRSVGGKLILQVNPVLENINGLHSLYSVKSQFYLSENNKITRLDGLVSLRSVYKLDISYNRALYNFCGLKGLLIFGTVDTLTIQGNLNNPTEEEKILQKSCGN